MSSSNPPTLATPEIRSVEREPVNGPYVRLRWNRTEGTGFYSISIWHRDDVANVRRFHYPVELDEALIPVPAGWTIGVTAFRPDRTPGTPSATSFRLAPPVRAEAPSDVVTGVESALRDLGSQVRAARKGRKLAIAAIAGKGTIGISRKTWRGIEKGLSGVPLSSYEVALRALDLIDSSPE